MLFASNYDGSLESYMDDFIDKISWGLNLVFTNGIGYPRTRWLIKDGCRDELAFKDYLRLHQVPTLVWHPAYGRLSTANVAANERLRKGCTRTCGGTGSGSGSGAVTLERADIQGLFARGYSNLSLASFVLLGFEDGGSGRSWLGDALAGITTSEDRPERRAVNVAFTASGSAVSASTARRWVSSPQFVSGMTAPHRRRILADEGTSAPERWDWGGPGTAAVDGVLLLYATDRAELTALEEEQTALLRRHGVKTSTGWEHRISTASSRSAGATASRSRSSRASARQALRTSPSRQASSSSATRTNTGC